jgi:hypothetical protein
MSHDLPYELVLLLLEERRVVVAEGRTLIRLKRRRGE